MTRFICNEGGTPLKQEQFVDLPLEDVIGDRFGRYSKYIIQDRALPDVRDGLKPVQRRIMFAMHVDGNTFEKNYRKAAKTVGTVIGNYHPHGDTSVYDAMVRLSQDWKMRNVLIEMHGNNGSIDGDPAAAMRYTETRLSNIASELLRDIEKETVDFIPNFDETISEPVVLPAKFPNLLVNGSTGISSGYATDIPPHNLNEVIDAVMMKIDHPNATVDRLMNVIKGPDFPTGGIIQGKKGIEQAYKTGKGRIIVRGRAVIEKTKGHREQIVIDEIPYDVNKANMVRKIDELSIDRKVEGITEVRDETDRTGLRIVIELRKGANSEGILNYLYKNTDLQVSYNFNMVAIQDRTPKLLSLPEIIDAYIEHQKDVLTRQTTFDLQKAQKRAHIVEGLIKAVSILDELIEKIRRSKNKQDAKERIKRDYNFSEEQAEAIVMLQLYRLTNTDITLLENEAAELKESITSLTAILEDEKKLRTSIKKELRAVKKRYGEKRRSVIEDEIEDIEIELDVTVASEDVIVSLTEEGYMKRTSIRSYAASNGEDYGMKEQDYVLGLYEMNTTDDILVFTNKGRYISVPVHELPEIRWKDLGQHLSNLTELEGDENVVHIEPIREIRPEQHIVFFTKNGMVKRSLLSEYQSKRFSRPLIAINVRNNDEVINVAITNGTAHLFITTNVGYGLWYEEQDVTVVGQRAGGVRSIQLKEGEHVISGNTFDPAEKQSLLVVTQRGACKRMKLSEFEQSMRANRGTMMLRELKAKPHRIKGFFFTKETDMIYMQTTTGNQYTISPLDLPYSDLRSNGSFVVDANDDGEVQTVWKKAMYTLPFSEEEQK